MAIKMNILFSIYIILSFLPVIFSRFCTENSHCLDTGYCDLKSPDNQDFKCDYGICTCPPGKYLEKGGKCEKRKTTF